MSNSTNNKLKNIPIIGKIAEKVVQKLRYNNSKFKGSGSYWEERYAKGGNSGFGSYEKFAEYKANIINRFVEDHGINTVIEFGCGDGNQLLYAKYKNYIGLDVSSTIIEQCKQKFQNDPSKQFELYVKDSYNKNHICDLSMSLDVIYHLIEQDIFEKHLKDVFEASSKFVIIYSSNENKEQNFHEKHRNFTDWVEKNMPNWKLIQYIENKYKKTEEQKEDTLETSHADFYIYQLKG